MKVELRRVNTDEKEIVYNLFNYYLYDMSEYTGWNLDSTGKIDFDTSILEIYWKEEDYYPYFILCDSEIAGFSFIRKDPFNESFYDIGQFFVLRKFKGKGIGRRAFELSVSKYPGKWLTRVLPNNKGAMSFWIKVISEITHGEYNVRKGLYKKSILMNFIEYEVRKVANHY